MSDKGEKTCPLCAEEMDMTDQQLKPCKCGYDICVWCWHHIMDMAEKDGTEGRCPACRVPYDKEKIVGMAANGRVIAEISTERKVKSQKSKGKPFEGRKQLSSVRVVQRNLVYVVGLPLNLGDEDLLQHKGYFGRYGKVLKVSMSRTSTGAIQQFPNNTCSVYITYSKEEEAARCIQAVHGFSLEGRLLRACFGTTKYCHTWLRNMPCSNPDCLYLHEFGSQVDSFTEDEIVSAHTRVKEITGATANFQFRSGNVLPPPLDENASNCAVPPRKLVANNASNSYPSLPSSTNLVKGSPPDSSSSRPASLPSGASRGLQGSSSQPSTTSSTNVVPPGNQKANVNGVPMAFSSIVSSTVPKTGPHCDSMKKLPFTDENQPLEAKEKLDSSWKKHTGSELEISSPNNKDGNKANFLEPHLLAREDGILNKSDSQFPVKSAWDDDSTDDDLYTSNGYASNGHLSTSKVCLSVDQISNSHPNDFEKPPSSDKLLSEIVTSERSKFTFFESPATEVQHIPTLSKPSQVSTTTYSEVDEDVRSFNIQRLNDTQVVSRPSYLSNHVLVQNVSNSSREMPIHLEDDVGSSCTDVSARDGFQLDASSSQVVSNRYNNYLAGEDGCLFPNAVDNQIICESNVYNGLYRATDLGENSIISDILYMDLESDGSLAARNLARLFTDVDKPNGSQLLCTSWNAQSNNNHSRFSFARHEETNFRTYAESSNPNFRQPSFSNNIIESRNQFLDKVGNNSIGFDNFEGYNSASCNQAAFSSNRLSVSRSSPISAPPGFSMPNRTVAPPPPGFASFERADHTFNAQPGHSFNHSLFRSSSEAVPIISPSWT